MEENHKEVSVPVTEVDVTPEWFSSILGYKINSTTFSITPNVHKGKGYLSNLLRVSCEKEGSSEKVNLIVKLMPEAEEMRSIVIYLELATKEILTYQMLLPVLVTQVPQLSEYICPFIYGKFEGSEDTYRSVLVLQDLKSLKYFTLDFADEANESQIHDGIDFLAKLHFAGALVEDLEGKPLNEVYDFLAYDLEALSFVFQGWMRNALPQVLKLFEKFNSSADIKKAFAAMTPLIADIIDDVLLNFSKIRSILHGDLWTYNILFNNDSLSHTKVIDWQLIGYSDVIMDLGIFIFSSLPIHKITIQNVQTLVKEYYHVYQKLCAEKKKPNLQQRRDWSQFETFFNTYGLAYTLIWFIMSMMALEGKHDAKLIKILKYFYKAGVVEFVNNIKRNKV